MPSCKLNSGNEAPFAPPVGRCEGNMEKPGVSTAATEKLGQSVDFRGERGLCACDREWRAFSPSSGGGVCLTLGVRSQRCTAWERRQGVGWGGRLVRLFPPTLPPSSVPQVVCSHPPRSALGVRVNRLPVLKHGSRSSLYLRVGGLAATHGYEAAAVVSPGVGDAGPAPLLRERGGAPVSRVRPSNDFPGGPLAGVPSLSREVKANRCRVAEL